MNIIERKPVKTPIFKIGGGNSNRTQKVHGQNPVKFPTLQIWKEMRFVEHPLQQELRERNVYYDAGKEWFDFSDVWRSEEDDSSLIHFIESTFLKLIRSSDSQQEYSAED